MPPASSHTVSIVIPFYNTERYLGRCLKSIVEQTYPHLEIILVDDGSTDASITICKDFASKDNRIKILSQHNSGASAARNKGLTHTHGDYVMFVDSDDWIDCVMVETLVKDILTSKADMVISQVPLDKPFTRRMTMDKMEALPILLGGTWWSPYGKLFSLSAIRDLRFPQATISEDYVFMLHGILKCEQIYYTPHCYYHRETRDGSLSHLPLSKRKFEEYDNVSYVARFIKEHHPQFKELAEARKAETSLKLLFCIYENKAPMAFRAERKKLVKSIRSNILHYVFNKEILPQTRLLLTMCITSPSAMMVQKFHARVKR